MKHHCTPSRAAFLALGVAIGSVLLAAGCGGKAPDHGSLTLVLEQPGGGSPLDTATYPTLATVYVEIDDSSGTPLVSRSFDATKPIELDHAPEGPGRVFVVQTMDSTGAILLSGVSDAVDLLEGEHVVITVILS